MIKKIQSLILLILLIFATVTTLPVSVTAQEDKSLDDLIAHLEQRIPDLMNSYNIPGVAIALVEDGEAAWVQAYGYADLEEGRIMTGDTYCRVQSISKSVTAWGVMKLVEQGKVDLDNPYSQYITEWIFPASI